MPRLFGTDGVRGLANADLTPELALALATAAARVLTAPPWSTAPAEAVARRESARRVAIELAGRGVEAPSDDSSDAPRFGERPFRLLTCRRYVLSAVHAVGAGEQFPCPLPKRKYQRVCSRTDRCFAKRLFAHLTDPCREHVPTVGLRIHRNCDL